MPFHWTSLNLYYIVNNLPLFSGNDRIESLEGALEPWSSVCGSFCPISVNSFESPSLVWIDCALVCQVWFYNSFVDILVRMSAGIWESTCLKPKHTETWQHAINSPWPPSCASFSIFHFPLIILPSPLSSQLDISLSQHYPASSPKIISPWILSIKFPSGPGHRSLLYSSSLFWCTFSLSLALPNANSPNLCLCLLQSLFSLSYLYYLVLQNKLPPNLTTKNDKLPVSIGKKHGSSLVGWLWIRSSLQVAIKVLSRAAVIWGLVEKIPTSNLTHRRPQFLTTWALHQAALAHGVHGSWLLPQIKVVVFLQPNLENNIYHFCHISFVRKETWSPAHSQGEWN